MGWVDAWLLELADLTAPAVAELVAAYRGLHQGVVMPAAVEALAERFGVAEPVALSWLIDFDVETALDVYETAAS